MPHSGSNSTYPTVQISGTISEYDLVFVIPSGVIEYVCVVSSLLAIPFVNRPGKLWQQRPIEKIRAVCVQDVSR